MSMLNWRRDPGYELRMKQLENEILRVRSDSERIEKDTRGIEKDTELIRKDTELLRRENARLRLLNARGRALLSFVDQHCFPPESSSIPPPSTAPGSSRSSR